MLWRLVSGSTSSTQTDGKFDISQSSDCDSKLMEDPQRYVCHSLAEAHYMAVVTECRGVCSVDKAAWKNHKNKYVIVGLRRQM